MPKKKPIPKWLKWEFWPFWFFYFPIYTAIIIYAIRARTLAFFTLANPGMKLGGFVDYSKFEILKQLDQKYFPKSVLIAGQTTAEKVLQQMKTEEISFPIIMKPDEGERGWKVEKINDQEGIEKYLPDCPEKILLQQFIPYPEEYGVMYFRFPSEKKGNVSSIVIRDFLSVTGDGTSTMIQLFENSERCLYHLEMLKELYKNELDNVLNRNEKKILVDIGNHSRGTTFLDGNHLISEQLAEVFDEASKTLHEWYFGRFDLRTQSWDELLRGNFKVVEVNGVNSEPAHIYDPHMSIIRAYKDLFRHWKTIFKISMQNRKRGFRAAPFRELARLTREHQRMKREHPNKAGA